MLQRLIHSFELKISGRNKSFLFRIPVKSNLCHQCGFRLYCHKVPVILGRYERTFPDRHGLFHLRLRYLTSKVDAQKKNDHIESINNKLEASKKINVKLKTSELKRLFGLAQPEKWTLTGKQIVFIQLYKLNIYSIERFPDVIIYSYSSSFY